jgi:hypothetical protein
MDQMIGGSAHPFQGQTQRELPINAPAMASNAAKT